MGLECKHFLSESVRYLFKISSLRMAILVSSFLTLSANFLILPFREFDFVIFGFLTVNLVFLVNEEWLRLLGILHFRSFAEVAGEGEKCFVLLGILGSLFRLWSLTGILLNGVPLVLVITSKSDFFESEDVAFA